MIKYLDDTMGLTPDTGYVVPGWYFWECGDIFGPYLTEAAARVELEQFQQMKDLYG